MKKTKIEWCDSTWNPVTGCLHGREYCYAHRIAIRFGGIWPDTKNHVLEKLNRTTSGKPDPYPFGFSPTFHRYKLDEPSRWKKTRTIFVCSMADLFGDWVPDEWIDEIFAECDRCPQHNYLFLTKNVRRYAGYGVPTGADNLWYGTSITKEEEMSRCNSLPAGCRTFWIGSSLGRRQDLGRLSHNADGLTNLCSTQMSVASRYS